MPTELLFLKMLLAIAFILAPIVTNCLLLDSSKIYRIVHFGALCILILGSVLDLNELAFAWPLFCVFGLVLHLKEAGLALDIQRLATFIPFVFSIIAGVWFFAGTNNLYLLGYDQHWSYYASLHGHYLGWIYLACLARLAQRKDSMSKYFAVACFVGLILFLFIAFGIDGIPVLKWIGVVGMSIFVPFFIVLHMRNSTLRIVKILSGISLVAVLISMGAALLNEFWLMQPAVFLGVKSMVSIHGVLNALFVVPFFYLAVAGETRGED